MAKRILNRKDLRADFDAAERRKPEDEQEEVEDEAETEEDDDAEEADAEGEEEEEASGEVEAGEAGEDEEEAPKKPKKKKAAPKPKAPKKTRSRSAKIIRKKVVWGVFNNSNQCVASFEYPKRKEADDLVAKLTAEKKNTHFIQPVKEPIEEKEK